MSLKKERIYATGGTLVFLTLVVLSYRSWTTPPNCADLASSRAPASAACEAVFKAREDLDRSYEFAMMPSVSLEQRGPIVTNLLAKAFSPLLQAYEKVFSRVTRQEILDQIRILKSPVFDGTYEGRAVIDHATPEAKRLIQIEGPGNAMRAYKLEKDPNIFRFDRVVYIAGQHRNAAKFDTPHALFRTIVTPVGEYGRDFAVDCLRTTEILMEIASNSLASESIEVFKTSPKLLLGEAARVMRASYHQADPANGPLHSLIEGILSFHQLISMVLATKIDGLDSGPDALRAFVKSGETKLGLASEITMRTPMAFTGPSIIHGFGYKNALYFEAGKLHLSRGIEDLLKEKKTSAEKTRPKRVCPMAGLLRRMGINETAAENSDSSAQSGIQIVAESYLKVFEVVRASRLANENR